MPRWAQDDVPKANGIRAPDLSFHKGLYYLYSSVSSFGNQRSVIGLTVNRTLDPTSPDYRWLDRGKVIESWPGKCDFNAIDPALFVDRDGTWYMFFGSFWSGIVHHTYDVQHLRAQRVLQIRPLSWTADGWPKVGEPIFEPKLRPSAAAIPSLVNSADFTLLSQFVHYTDQRFDLPWLAGAFTDSRPQPEIPSRAVWLSLILGEVVQIGSHLQLEEETQLPQWQRWVGYPKPISHDTFGYVSERLDPAQLRRAAVWISRKLKRGKAFEASKLKGLLVVSLDTNEQFCSEHRCCEDCLSREVTCKHATGQEYKKTQYYHKQVYAQVSGPGLSNACS